MVGPVEVDERNRDPTVLGLLVRPREHRTETGRDPVEQVEVGIDPLEGEEGVGGDRGGAHAAGGRALWRTDHAAGGRAEAVASLTTISPASAVPSMVTVVVAAGPVTMSSRWDSPTRKKWNRPLWTPTDIRSCTFWPRTVSRPTVRSARRISTAARQARACVCLSGEVEQLGVAAELEEPPPVGHGDVEERDEAGADGGGELLGPDLPVFGEALGELGEAGDVDEGDGALELAVTGLRLSRHPLDGEPGEVRRERAAGLVRRALGCLGGCHRGRSSRSAGATGRR